ncbi:Arm DNA-binding domain-containing protein [Arenibaculum sp.]|jgi:hypothetical protein|uniref:Arm DNA-binding domain-containing protein n=1 Tax=Arenibaculum sp. TaxID=2865862 RepID=UPI002E13E257|nr:Arm DNA-binding domain-containing protein [Arenibaculum sp.]
MRITKRSVDAAQPGTRDTFLWDAGVKGFGLKVTPGGSRVYILQYRMLDGRSRRFTIGKHGSPWTPDLARQEAERLLRAVAEGRDPQQEKETARVKETGDTVAELYELFMKRHVSQTRIEREYRSAFKNEILPY